MAWILVWRCKCLMSWCAGGVIFDLGSARMFSTARLENLLPQCYMDCHNRLLYVFLPYCALSNVTAIFQLINRSLYPQTKVGDILDSGPSRRRRRRRRRNFLVDAITQKQINIFFSNLVHMLRVSKGRSLF